MKRSESHHDLQRVLRLKWLLLLLDVFILLTALGTFGITLWVRFDLDFMVWVPLMNWYSYWYCTYVVMFAMVLAIPTVVLHAFGVLSEWIHSFGWVIALNIFTIFMECVGFIVILIYGIEDSRILYQELRKVFHRLVFAYDHDEGALRVLKMIQDLVKCCGSRGAEDYIDAFKPVPWECREHVSGNEYRYGCAQKMQWWLEPWSAFMAAACLALVCMQIGQMVATSKLKKTIIKYHRASDYEYD